MKNTEEARPLTAEEEAELRRRMAHTNLGRSDALHTINRLLATLDAARSAVTLDRETLAAAHTDSGTCPACAPLYASIASNGGGGGSPYERVENLHERERRAALSGSPAQPEPLDVAALREAFEAGWKARDKQEDHVGSGRGYAAVPVDPSLIHDRSCCAARGCHPVCSHLCGTDLHVCDGTEHDGRVNAEYRRALTETLRSPE